jgi:biofilm PGA synthesis N-glycosyltransferase PgaC
MGKRRIIAIIPAHNEEQTVGDTIRSLLNQTYRTDVFVISDNSTDRTVEIARSFGVRVAETVDNTHRKSGAMNQAISAITGYDFVITVDADTFVGDDFVEIAMEEFRRDPRLGAVCSRAGIIRPRSMTTGERALWHFQHVDYAEFDSSRLERPGEIKVVHGMAAVYKYKALKDVEEYRRRKWGVAGQYYDERSMTEDYELTICLKELAYHVTVGMGMMAWTDVPVSLRQLWIQRTRWLRGGLETLFRHGWNNATARDIVNAGFFWVMFTFHVVLFAWIIGDLLSGLSYSMSPWTAFVLLVLYIDGVYRLKFVQNPEFADMMVKVLFVPMIIYTWFNMAVQIFSYCQAILRINPEW